MPKDGLPGELMLEKIDRFLETLAAFDAQDAASGHFRQRMVRLLEDAGPQAFTRHHFVPGHITGSAFIVSPKEGLVLLHHHRRLDRWLQMGGHSDGELDPAEIARREGTEESGLSDLEFLDPGILDLDIHEIPAARGEPAHEHFDVRYALFTGNPGSISRQEDESNDLMWFSLTEAIEKMKEPGAERAIARLGMLLQNLSDR
jgi:8-oxo-dGTP pyrophosphatase MutT (NUDIX family)